MKTTLPIVLLMSLQIALAQSSDAVFIYMASGPGIEVGTIEEDDPGNYLVLRTPMGQLKRINYSEIDSIAYKNDIEGVPSVSSGHSPILAGTLSALIPGAGQVYNGEYGKAVLYPLSMIGITAVAGILVFVTEWSLSNTSSSMSVGGIIFTVLGGASVLSMYVLGIIDAAESASRLRKMGQFMAAGAASTSFDMRLAMGTSTGQSITVQIPVPF